MYSIPFPGNEIPRAYQQTPFLEQKPPEIVGEGDIISCVCPDGTVLFYFIPAVRRNPCPQQFQANVYPTNSYLLWPQAPEIWFVRSVCNVNPLTYFYNNAPNSPGNQQIPNNLANINNCPIQYYQKFHYDNSTSTSDIHYFYPSLRYPSQKLQICAAVQVDALQKCACCVCFQQQNTNFRRKEPSIENMSVDETAPPTYITKRVKFNNIKCICKNEKSDKYTATYVDTSSGSSKRGVRESTAQRSRKNEKTEERPPKRKYNKRRSPCHSSDCSCLSDS